MIPRAFDSRFVDAEGIFALSKRIAEDARRTGSATDIRVWIDNALVQTDSAEYLPRAEDPTASAFVERARSLAGRRGFSVMFNRLHRHSSYYWERFAAFFSSVYGLVGMPPGGADSDVLIGQYRHTGFGVHRDDASNFTLVLEGKKRVLAWPAETLIPGGVENTCRYETIRPLALVLDAGPGDAIYWPSSYWHVGESHGLPSLTLQLACYLGPNIEERACDRAAEAFGAMLKREAKSSAGVDMDWAAASRQALSDGQRIEDRIAEMTLCQASARGFLDGPMPEPDTSRELSQRFRRRVQARVEWAPSLAVTHRQECLNSAGDLRVV